MKTIALTSTDATLVDAICNAANQVEWRQSFYCFCQEYIIYLTVCLSSSADLICAFNMSLWMSISWRRCCIACNRKTESVELLVLSYFSAAKSKTFAANLCRPTEKKYCIHLDELIDFTLRFHPEIEKHFVHSNALSIVTEKASGHFYKH